MGAALAGWPGNAVLHAFSRSPPSRAGVYARASARIPVAEQGRVWDLELGKAVERVRVAWHEVRLSAGCVEIGTQERFFLSFQERDGRCVSEVGLAPGPVLRDQSGRSDCLYGRILSTVCTLGYKPLRSRLKPSHVLTFRTP
jgi:hypothetical protein